MVSSPKWQCHTKATVLDQESEDLNCFYCEQEKWLISSQYVLNLFYAISSHNNSITKVIPILEQEREVERTCRLGSSTQPCPGSCEMTSCLILVPLSQTTKLLIVFTWVAIQLQEFQCSPNIFPLWLHRLFKTNHLNLTSPGLCRED